VTLNREQTALLLLLSLACASSASGAGIVIGHTNVMGVAALPQGVMDRVAQFRWFFAHASVGDNMMDGIATLHAADPARYPIDRISSGDAPPGTTDAASIYDNARGNPTWQEKVSWFEGYVDNGWRGPSVHVALNKFCWIDPYVDTNTYLASMKTLEGLYPDTLFVYMTIPLTHINDYENDCRNAFNRTLRNFCAANNRVLFDVADIEAHNTAGTAQTYNTTNQWMYNGFAVYPAGGDWHLNETGQPWVARGFYALGAALLATDRDGDGQTDGEELLAGMCPTSSASCFQLSAPSNTGGRFVVSWPSASNRVYTLQRATNLTGVTVYTNLLTNAAACPPLNIYTDAPAGTGPWFYKVGVRQ
jgi:hypothetical protein